MDQWKTARISIDHLLIAPVSSLAPDSSSTMHAHNKARNPSGRLQQHHRSASGGGSKVGLNNLALTQTDSAQQKQQQNLKRSGNSNSAVDLLQGRPTHLRAAHLTSNSRVRSKEQITVAHKRVHAPPSNKGKQQQPQNRPQRPNFSIARSDDTTDSDDEWVSSESGAATPQIHHAVDTDEEEEEANTGGRGTVMPVERQRAIDESLPPANKMNGGNDIYGKADRAPNGFDDVSTPRAELDVDLTRVDTVRPDTAARTAAAVLVPPTSQQDEMIPPPVVRVQAQSTPVTPVPTPPPPPILEQPTAKAPPVRQVRSEAPSPTQLRQKSAAKRTTLARHTSTHGDVKRDMPPHPLIRGQSYHGTALRPARLAPLTVNSEAAQAQLTASPSTPSRAGSPSYFSSSFKESPTGTSTDSQDRVPSRKNSISSLHSVTTLPAPVSTRFVGGWGRPDRTRTLSTISTSSSSAALTALSTLPTMSRPSSPPLVVRFPAENRRDPNEGFHQLLPPQYLATHMTVLAKYNPLYDSYERVMRAKHGQ
ncbi:hypothetical protein ACEPAI_8045 [Sanghuangporus weigelae]